MLAGEFVERWDSALDSRLASFDGHLIKTKLQGLVQHEIIKSTGKRPFSKNDSEYAELAAAMQPKSRNDVNRRLVSDPQRPFFAALNRLLSVDETKVEYLNPLLNVDKVSLIATLNYDLSVEKAAEDMGVSYDYGLTKWTEQRKVEWKQSGAGCRLLKLHGSLNWIGTPEELVSAMTRFRTTKSAL